MTREYYCEETDTKIVYDYLFQTITIDDKIYTMASEEESCGEWKDALTREISNYRIKDHNGTEYVLSISITNDMCGTTLSYDLHTLA